MCRPDDLTEPVLCVCRNLTKSVTNVTTKLCCSEALESTSLHHLLIFKPFFMKRTHHISSHSRAEIGASSSSAITAAAAACRTAELQSSLRHPETQTQHTSLVVCMSWCPDFEFRGTYQSPAPSARGSATGTAGSGPNESGRS